MTLLTVFLKKETFNSTKKLKNIQKKEHKLKQKYLLSMLTLLDYWTWKWTAALVWVGHEQGLLEEAEINFQEDAWDQQFPVE